MIELRQLEMLQAVALAGSFAGAATKLFVTPSAVSQQMSALERSMGTTLFTRSTRGVQLTEAGELLATTAQTVQGELNRLRRRLATLGDDVVPTLTIATFTSAGEHILAPALAELTAQFDHRIDVTVYELEPEDAIAGVQDGSVDLAVTFSFESSGPTPALVHQTLKSDDLQLVVPANDPLANFKRVSWDRVRDYGWVSGWGATGDAFERLASAHGSNPRIACRSSDYHFMQALVGAGLGIALIPELALTDRADTATLSITPTATRRISMYVAPRLADDHPAQLLAMIIRELNDR